MSGRRPVGLGQALRWTCFRHSSLHFPSLPPPALHAFSTFEAFCFIFFFFLSNDALISMAARISVAENVAVALGLKGSPGEVQRRTWQATPARRAQG